MDSLTQIVLGACVTAASVPPAHRRKAAWLGAFLGTLPDLDVFINYGGPVENFTMHRGFSHSLFFLTGLGGLLWLALRRWWAPVREHPRPWLAGIMLALLTHPLLDAHTAYGTQLFWPFTPPPVAWATLFIIDPLYTLPLLFGFIVLLICPTSSFAARCLVAVLALSTLYLSWSWTAQTMVAANARQSLKAEGHSYSQMFITPAPFNTLLWRVVALTEGGYFEGVDSLVADDGPIQFTFHPSDHNALAAAAKDVPAACRLQWFANGFVSASVENDILVVDDLRMGHFPDYVFRHAVAQQGNPHWHAIPAQRLPMSSRSGLLSDTWNRIWSAEPNL